MLNAPLEWRIGIMGSWTKGFNPKLFGGERGARGCPSQSTGRPGAERSQGTSRPISRTHMCCFLPLHPPSPELSSLLQRELGGRKRTASDTRVGGTPASLQNGLLIPSSPNPATATLSMPTPIPENTWKEMSALRPLARRGGLTVTCSLGA